MNGWMAVAAAAASAGTALVVGSQAMADDDTVRAALRDPRGHYVGSVRFTEHGDVTRVRAFLRPNPYVEPGEFHGFHVHANDDPANGNGCVADPSQPSSTWFVSADGHLAGSGQQHGMHDGDMPSPLVLADGRARLRFVTDRLDVDTLAGRAVILHSGPDNFGNVPTGDAADQYTPNSPEATEKTAKTGNAGDRVACGVVRGD